jgi:hypothetical protein
VFNMVVKSLKLSGQIIYLLLDSTKNAVVSVNQLLQMITDGFQVMMPCLSVKSYEYNA